MDHTLYIQGSMQKSSDRGLGLLSKGTKRTTKSLSLCQIHSESNIRVYSARESAFLAKTSCHRLRFSASFDKITALTASGDTIVAPLSPQVNVACFDSGHLLHHLFQVGEISNIDLGGERGNWSSNLLLPFS